MGVWYATREDVKSAPDLKLTARDDAQVDRVLESSSRSVEGLLHRLFYPWTGTRYFDWPNQQHARPWRLWLDQDELADLTAITIGGATADPDDFLLRPDHGPPYTRLEADMSTAAAFAGGTTHQRSIALTGIFIGCAVDEAPAGALAGGINSAVTTLAVTDSAAIGVGQVIRIDSERMLVTGKTALTTAQTLQTPVGANNNEVTLAVTTGTAYAVGEVLLLDAERMLIVDIAANNLIVKRAWDGTVLATHTGSTIYAPRTLTVTRGALGTTAAAHSNAAAIVKQVPPGLVSELTIAETVVVLEQRTSAYARTAGSGDNQRESTGRGLQDLRDRAYTAHGRKARTRAV